MTSARRAPLFPGFTTVYLKALGELMICANRLQHALDVTEGLSDAWRARADELVGEALRVGETVASARAGHAVRVTMSDGTAVVADLDYLNGLVRKMHRHHSLALLQASLAEGQLVAS
jgi:hypothetical protein